MSMESYEKELKSYEEDPRVACQYGEKCYQKNPNHHAKYKHPPKNQQKDAKESLTTGKKRSSSECENDSSDSDSPAKTKFKKDPEAREGAHSLSPSPPPNLDESNSSVENDSKMNNNDTVVDERPAEKTKNEKEEEKMNVESEGEEESSSTDPKSIIKKLFLTKMPDDFYKLYDFCKSLSPRDPSLALKLVDLKLVGPYDVLNGKIQKAQNEPEKYLRHWRYYYDPPEFQTVLKGNDKEGLHYGYWRDDIEEDPIFVAKNSANKGCNIEAVAPNIFGAVSKHIGVGLAKASPFEKGPILKLWKQLKTFANDNDISLDSENVQMRTRARSVVAKTFHGVGIVVPYDKKTQLGYRDLAATDSQMKRILKKIDEAESEEERKKAMVSLEEIVRLATIAADESDFGTCLELGHDLFVSGIVHVQRMGLRMLASAYNLLNRKKFLSIAEAHAKDRKKGSDLGVL